MDKIIGFSDDDLVVKILSFLPTKAAVSTSVLSKHWKFLWKRVTKLEFDENLINKLPLGIICAVCGTLPDSIIWKSERLHRFIAMNLPLHPVIESLRLKLLTEIFEDEDIKSWVEIAVSRCVHELSVACLNALLPSSMYTCKSLVTLKLGYSITVDVPRVVCLPSLKTLHLDSVKYADGESLQRLLSNCSGLEDLIVDLMVGENVRKFTVRIPSFLGFEITCSNTCGEYVIDTPSLKYFKVRGRNLSSSFLFVNMPKLEKADIALNRPLNIKKLLKHVTSVKRLSLVNYAEVVYVDDDIVFHELERLKFHIRYTKIWSKSLLWFLKSSPKLRDLDFDFNFDFDEQFELDTSVLWKQLNYVPRCLLSSLQTFKWKCSNPTSEARDLATYILKNSCRLKTATFLIPSDMDQQMKLEIENELVLSSRGSTTCSLVFATFDSKEGF